MYFGLVFSDARKEARSAKPSFFAITVISASMRVDLAQTELVNLVRRHVSRGAGVDVVFVALLAVGQRGDRESRCGHAARIRCEGKSANVL